MTDDTESFADPIDKDEGRLLAVVIDDERARILDFDLNAPEVSASERRVRDKDPRTRHLRTVERHTRHGDEGAIVPFLDEIAETLQNEYLGRRFVLLGHGDGTSDAAALFLDRARKDHPLVAGAVIAERRIDLSAATDADIEEAAVAAGQEH